MVPIINPPFAETAGNCRTLFFHSLLIKIFQTGRLHKFKLVNYGKTPALDIRFDEIPLIDTGGLKSDYLISPIDYLPPERIVDITIKKKINNEITDTDTFDRGALDPRSAHRALDIEIRYKNAVNDKFTIRGKLGTDTFIVDKIKKIY